MEHNVDTAPKEGAPAAAAPPAPAPVDDDLPF